MIKIIKEQKKYTVITFLYTGSSAEKLHFRHWFFHSHRNANFEEQMLLWKLLHPAKSCVKIVQKGSELKVVITGRENVRHLLGERGKVPTSRLMKTSRNEEGSTSRAQTTF